MLCYAVHGHPSTRPHLCPQAFLLQGPAVQLHPQQQQPPRGPMPGAQQAHNADHTLVQDGRVPAGQPKHNISKADCSRDAVHNLSGWCHWSITTISSVF